MPWVVVAVLGMLAGDVAATEELSPWFLAILAAGGALSFWVSRSRRARALGLGALAAALGYSDASLVYRPALPADHIANFALPATLRVEGRMVGEPEQREQSLRVELEVERVWVDDRWRAATGAVLVTLRSLEQPWLAGDRIETSLRMRRPRNFGNPGEFDYERYLARRGIYVTSFVESDARFHRLGESQGWRSWISRWRVAAREAYVAGLPNADAQLLSALILGTARELPESLQAAFRRTGTSHVLAISGLNVSLVAGAAYFVFRWLLARSRRLLLFAHVPKLATAFSLLPVVLYAGIAGSNLATLRALAMLAIVLAAVLADRLQRPLIALAAAAGFILLLWPGSALDPSFQLSFAAVLGLLVGMARFDAWWRAREDAELAQLQGRRARIRRAIVTYVVVSLVASLPTVPLVAFHFNQVSLVAPIANAVVVPLLGALAVGIGMLSAFVAPVSATLAAWIASLAYPALAVGRTVVERVGSWSWASVPVPTPTPVELVLVYAMVAALMVLAPRRRRIALAVLLCCTAADGLYWWRERFGQTDLRVTFLSVGQGDCAVVELPGGEVAVVDGGGLVGGTFDVGDRVVAPFLWSKKIWRVDYLILSHPDWDHFGGLGSVAALFRPRELWWSGQGAHSTSFARFWRQLGEAGVVPVEMKRGARRSLAGVVADVLSPATLEQRSENDSSLVVALRYGGRSVLFTGDIEAAAEGDLVAGQLAALASAVVKVPHHGSRSSSTEEFLAAARPTLAIGSMGFANRFGFPHPLVVRRYREVGATFLRTDRDGAITIVLSSDGGFRAETARVQRAGI